MEREEKVEPVWGALAKHPKLAKLPRLPSLPRLPKRTLLALDGILNLGEFDQLIDDGVDGKAGGRVNLQL